MGKPNKNTLLRYKNVITIVQEYYDEDTTTYSGIFRKYVEPIYPMTYQTFIKIINTPVEKLLKECAENKLGNQKKTI